ncbi:imelysin family protein [Diaphorobacter ruginosibacter]|uniref:Imelysin family protein n=1 Tax=Diaphorobacter ruginosibacter TaxID=1715720 RepID=A0A7G9RII7_9BURK|nr:imelysin family protein [Diaphorobacter ruginosibacter]QNN55412.1 imelysin family protein [Diaphorobacter ruginosibacter]
MTKTPFSFPLPGVRGLVCAGVMLGIFGALEAKAQEPVRDAAMPYYTAADMLQSLYGKYLPERAEGFVSASKLQERALAGFCSGAETNAGALRTQWRQTHAAWLALSTPNIGPLVVRRSLRQIDFTPIRSQLIERAVRKAPQTAADMELIGTPAKGFGALDWLLHQGLKPSTAECAFALQVAKAITVEAAALASDFKTLESRRWNEGSEEGGETSGRLGATAEETGSAMAEWVNQWLGGVERLRWIEMEKPIKTVEGTDKPASFARMAMADNLLEWQAQWQSLLMHALLTPAQRQLPPVPGKDLISIEALLLTKGHIALSLRWRDALGAVTMQLNEITKEAGGVHGPQAGDRANERILALAARLKAITVMFQSDIAPALDIPLGFNDTDGD